MILLLPQPPHEFNNRNLPLALLGIGRYCLLNSLCLEEYLFLYSKVPIYSYAASVS